MVKGLAKFGNRLRHDQPVKYVDASPSKAEGDYSPMTAAIIPKMRGARQRIMMLNETASTGRAARTDSCASMPS